MNIPDLINSTFGAASSAFLLHNCYDLFKNKAVSGMTISSTIFYWIWGAWNCYYYSSLDQTFSFYCNLAVCFSNTLMAYLVIKYKSNVRTTKGTN